MSDGDLAFDSASDLGRLLRARRISAVELTQLFLARAEALNSLSKAFTRVTETEALKAAKAADSALARGDDPGPLLAIPFTSKDMIDIAGQPTSGGAKGFADGPATADAPVIASLRAAGAVSLGKANLHAFAYGATGENRDFGTAVNAYDPGRLAGGSSSGSAASVAFGLATASLGTDTGGSVRVPAALSGLVGLKPTYGRISLRGVLPFSWSLDHLGTITRTVRDAAALLQCLAAFDPQDPASAPEPVSDYLSPLGDPAPLTGLTIGVPRRFFFEHADDEILAAAEAVLLSLEGAGAKVREVALPEMTHARTVALTVQMPEALSLHASHLDRKPEVYSDDFRAGLALGQFILAEHFIRAKRIMTLYRRQTEAVFDGVDVLLTPATPLVAPEFGTVSTKIGGLEEPVGNAMMRFSTFFNMTGHPAITLPSGLSSQGLPMSVQLVGRYFDEAKLLRVASKVEEEERFRLPRPLLHRQEKAAREDGAEGSGLTRRPAS